VDNDGRLEFRYGTYQFEGYLLDLEHAYRDLVKRGLVNRMTGELTADGKDMALKLHTDGDTP